MIAQPLYEAVMTHPVARQLFEMQDLTNNFSCGEAAFAERWPVLDEKIQTLITDLLVGEYKPDFTLEDVEVTLFAENIKVPKEFILVRPELYLLHDYVQHGSSGYGHVKMYLMRQFLLWNRDAVVSAFEAMKPGVLAALHAWPERKKLLETKYATMEDDLLEEVGTKQGLYRYSGAEVRARVQSWLDLPLYEFQDAIRLMGRIEDDHKTVLKCRRAKISAEKRRETKRKAKELQERNARKKQRPVVEPEEDLSFEELRILSSTQ